MCRADCEYYFPKEIAKNLICRSYTGDVNNKNQISKCRYYCSYYECLELMKGNDRKAMHRRRGALRNNK